MSSITYKVDSFSTSAGGTAWYTGTYAPLVNFDITKFYEKQEGEEIMENGNHRFRFVVDGRKFDVEDSVGRLDLERVREIAGIPAGEPLFVRSARSATRLIKLSAKRPHFVFPTSAGESAPIFYTAYGY